MLLPFLVATSLSAQERKTGNPWALSANYFYGSILEHSPNIGHLITGHPTGLLVSYDRKTFGEKSWQRIYNYPDVGLSFLFQDMKNAYLGENYGVYAHYGFYFFNRKLLLKAGTGLSYNTNPYDPDTNYRNNAYGSTLMSSTFLLLNYKRKIYEQLGFQAGLLLVHYSNGNFKAPNTSTNTFAFNLGLNYSIGTENAPTYIPRTENDDYSEPVHYNFVFRGGIHSSDVIGMGQYPFYIFSAFADKRISKKSSFSLGAELFLSKMLEELIYYKSVAYPEENVSGEEDAKRVGVFAGYELHIGEFSGFVNLGYYVYYPYEFEGKVYERLGLRYYLSEDWFVGMAVKAHAAKAEAAEFSVGYRW